MTETVNPWLTRAGSVAEAAPAPTPGPVLPPPTGPTAPQPHVPVPDAVDRLPRRQLVRSAPLWWVGVHGGAGESTLAALVPGSRATDHAWPVTPTAPSGGSGERVVLVARTNMRGLRAAQRAAAEWASGSLQAVDLLGLVLVADAPGRLPRPLRDLSAVVSGGVPRVWQLPWIEAWRMGEDPAAQPAPKQLRRLLEDLQALVPSLAARGTH